MADEVLTIKEGAALLKLAGKTVYAIAQAGEIPGFKIRGQWRIKPRGGESGGGNYDGR